MSREIKKKRRGKREKERRGQREERCRRRESGEIVCASAPAPDKFEDSRNKQTSSVSIALKTLTGLGKIPRYRVGSGLTHGRLF